MKLTGKANIDFHTWVNKEYPNVIFETLMAGFGEITTEPVFMEDIFDIDIIGDIALNALIIEWLDSVTIHVNIVCGVGLKSEYYPTLIYQDENFIRRHESINDNDNFNSRQEATKSAIERANEIYNTQHFAQ